MSNHHTELTGPWFASRHRLADEHEILSRFALAGQSRWRLYGIPGPLAVIRGMVCRRRFEAAPTLDELLAKATRAET